MTVLRDLYPVPKRMPGTRSSAGLTDDRHETAKRRMEESGAFLISDWKDFVFLHFEVDPARLQREVPFPLDCFEGRCFVSLVAFTMRRMRFFRGGSLTEWMTAPIATHQFLNLRTYVTDRGEAGIFFLQEWLNNRLSVALGPWTFGLPYRYARIEFENKGQEVTGSVEANRARIAYRARNTAPHESLASGSWAEFLLERYSAYMAAGVRPGRFRVWHEPWVVGELEDVRLEDLSLVTETRDWFDGARFVGGHHSNGAEDIWMGAPVPVRPMTSRT